MTIHFKQSRVLSALSLTPLIDVVFLLLIFFLVASRLSQEDHQLDIALPSAANAVPMTSQPQELIVNVDQTGRYFVDGQELTLMAFDAMLQQRVVDNPLNQTVIVRADRRVVFQAPIDIMNVCLKYNVPYSASIADEQP